MEAWVAHAVRQVDLAAQVLHAGNFVWGAKVLDHQVVGAGQLAAPQLMEVVAILVEAKLSCRRSSSRALRDWQSQMTTHFSFPLICRRFDLSVSRALQTTAIYPKRSRAR